jgi:short subunit dehydrogenase-like uncharacterized protein
VDWHNPINSVPAPVADTAVVKLGQQISELQKEKGVSIQKILKPTRFAAHFTLKTYTSLIFVIYLGFLFKLTSIFGFFERFVIRHPDWFTFGVFKAQGPSSAQLEESSFECRFLSKGYSTENVSKDPDLKYELKVQGPEPGYVTTPICVVESARMLLLNRGKIPNGVLTPASAFAAVFDDLVERFKINGVLFSVVSRAQIGESVSN